MIDIIPSSDTARVAALLAPRRTDDAALARRVRRIVEDVRTGGDAALRGRGGLFIGWQWSAVLAWRAFSDIRRQ